MIIQATFHCYKDNFPLLYFKDQFSFYSTLDDNARHDLMNGLIMELSDLIPLPYLAHLQRQDKDNMVLQHDLDPFYAKYPEFLDHHGRDKRYRIPTILFVGHFEDDKLVDEVKEKLKEKEIKYVDDIEQQESFEKLNQIYWEEKSDAEPFVKYAHQTTMIGLDLLKTADYKQKLEQLNRLEYMQYTDMEDAKSDFREMVRYLSENSSYYRENIASNPPERKQFWENFTKIKIAIMDNDMAQISSWPRFLFNICGIFYTPKDMPFKVSEEEIFKD